MKYLYGDATESPLDINYLDLLRDTLDFGTSVMLAHGNITEQRSRAKDLQAKAKHEREQLDSVNDDVDRSLGSSKKRVDTKSAKACVDAIRAVAVAEIKRADSAIQARLAKELGQINEAVSREQANNLKRLEALLLKHDLPECALWVNTRFAPQANRYIAELIGKASCDVAFVIDLEIPSEHLLAEPLRIDRIAPNLTIKVPEKAGWVRKSVKMKPHKLTKEYVVAVSHSTKRTTIKLRNALQDADSGYDIIYGSKNRVAVSRLAKGAEADPFEPEIGDKKQLLAFYDELNRSLNRLKSCRRALRGAQLDQTPLAEHADATVLVRRLVQQMAPVVQEISRHSLSPNELVLKRVLADDRREEIFLAKADLQAKLDPLPTKLRKIFAPLGLDPHPDLTGPPPPMGVAKTKVMEEPAKPVPAAGAPAMRAPAPTKPEPSTQRIPETGSAVVTSASPKDDSPVVSIQDEETSVQEKDDFLPQIDDAVGGDEALPLPLENTAVVPDIIPPPPPEPRNTLPLGGASQKRGVSMPSASRRRRGRSGPPAMPKAPSSNRSAIPKPSSPPRRSRPEADDADESGGPTLEIQAHDSVDIQLDELLNKE